MSTINDQNIKDKEQQLKDLDAEERLLLIDRSIKSSLIQGHEDIATCVDRLEFLDKMTISLPIMARCWTVVETIRKVSDHILNLLANHCFDLEFFL